MATKLYKTIMDDFDKGVTIKSQEVLQDGRDTWTSLDVYKVNGAYSIKAYKVDNEGKDIYRIKVTHSLADILLLFQDFTANEDEKELTDTDFFLYLVDNREEINTKVYDTKE